eukprot:CAMPEP_0198262468 /NCGR_PEP_ID=MMETSP1447-20131203/10977_1 /TAXON_ID=420782 /ORGANISM="Chaetoceros dichaeta, Strain CCMP1751" /LENGTH=143 /DNA_ID=CAMNT_0043950719 /DNA_START=118 /DNA_END=546 /DNA_ORIENTATION=+
MPCNSSLVNNSAAISGPYNYQYQDHYNLYVVYFVNCKIHDGYGTYIKGQLKHVPAHAFLKIVAISSDCKKEKILYDAYNNLLLVNTVLECHDEPDDKPTFEYYGIRAMWEIGQMLPHRNSVVFYFHSKGITHFKTFEEYKLES